jgi:hypothetical protein
MPATDTIVCCVKWGTKYPAIYTNRLRAMVKRHLKRPHRFACLTEDPTGLDPDIEVIPLPNLQLAGWWHKLSLFKKDLIQPNGATILYLDVDLVILGELDFLFDDSGGFYVTASFKRGRPSAYNSSLMRWQAGEHSHVYDRFIADHKRIVASGRYFGDQDWLFEHVPGAKHWPRHKIVSYKQDLSSHAYRILKRLRLQPKWLRAPRWLKVDPPIDASVVVFHGKPDPEDVMYGPYGPWKHAPFIADAWR